MIANTDTQDLTISGQTLSLTNGGSVTLPDTNTQLTLNNTNTSTSTTEAATANSAKLAYDRGSLGVNTAGAAQGTANSAVSLGNAALPKAGGEMTGALTINLNGDALNLRSTTNGQPANITFSTNVPDSQIGHIKYNHSNSASYGGGDSFTIGGTETTTVILADGLLMYKDGIYSKPASGTGAGTRKDANWDTAYGWGDHGSAEYGTSNLAIGITSTTAMAGNTTIPAAEAYTAHEDITQATANLSNSGRTYIQGITLDSNGHVTAVATNTETVENTNTQNSAATTWAMFSGSGINTSTGVITNTTYAVGNGGLTQNNFTNALKTSYDGAATHAATEHAPSTAEQNVQSNWDATSGDAFIDNKPTIPSGNAILDWTTDRGTTNIHTGNYINTTYNKASSTVLGLVKVGSGLAISGAGVLSVSQAAEADEEVGGAMSSEDKIKLNDIEAEADVTDATNVAAAGASMKSATETISGAKTFSSTIAGSINGNSATTSERTITSGEISAISTNTTTAGAALPKVGGIMTGKVTLDGAPTSDLHAATKAYVDARKKQLQVYHANFKDNAGTTEHFIPLAGVPDEMTAATKEQAAIIMPCSGTIKEIILRMHWTSTITTSDDITWKIYNRESNKKMNGQTQLSTFTMTNPTQGADDANNTRSSGELSQTYSAGDSIMISMQWASTGPTSTADRMYVTVVVENDWDTIGY